MVTARDNKLVGMGHDNQALPSGRSGQLDVWHQLLSIHEGMFLKLLESLDMSYRRILKDLAS